MKTKRITNRQAFELVAQGDTRAASALLFKYKDVIFKQISTYDLWQGEDIEDIEISVMIWIIESMQKFDTRRLK